MLKLVYTTEDEEYSPQVRIAGSIEEEIRKAKLDTYNHRYVVIVEIIELTPGQEEEEGL